MKLKDLLEHKLPWEHGCSGCISGSAVHLSVRIKHVVENRDNILGKDVVLQEGIVGLQRNEQNDFSVKWKHPDFILF